MSSEGDTTQILSRDDNIQDECSIDNKRKYRRISLTKRNLLLEKIFFENKKIKNAARELGINYSSAKTILHLYRKKAKKQSQNGQNEQKRCGYTVLRDALAATTTTLQSANSAAPAKAALNKIDIVVSQGGRNMCSISVNNAQQAQNSAPLAHLPLFGGLATKLDAHAHLANLQAAAPIAVNPFSHFVTPVKNQQTPVNLDDSNVTAVSQQQMAPTAPFQLTCPPNALFLQQIFHFQQALLNAYRPTFMQQ